MTEVVRSATALYEVVLAEVQRGSELVARRPDGTEVRLVVVSR